LFQHQKLKKEINKHRILLHLLKLLQEIKYFFIQYESIKTALLTITKRYKRKMQKREKFLKNSNNTS